MSGYCAGRAAVHKQEFLSPIALNYRAAYRHYRQQPPLLPANWARPSVFYRGSLHLQREMKQVGLAQS